MIWFEVAVNLLTRTWFRIRSVTSARPACRKIAVLSLIRSQRQLACGGLYYPKQCIAKETLPCDHPVIFHEFCLCTAVAVSAEWGVPVPYVSLLEMLCLVFVGECIGKVINFKWLSKNTSPTLVIWLERLNSSSQWLDQSHFCQLMQLWSHASPVARFREYYYNHKFMSIAGITLCMHSRWHVISTSHRWTNTC